MTDRGTKQTDELGMVATERTAELAVATEAARARAEIEGQIIVARRFPRDELINGARITKMCQRPAFAKTAFYSFPRGGKQIMGPSVNLARAMSSYWGNMTWGIRVLRDDGEMIVIEGWAWDLENNNRVSMPDSFNNLIFRKKGGWQKPDERDKRELVNRRGAICVRNALLQLLPPDIVDEAFNATMKMAQQDVTGSAEKTLRNLLAAYDGLGVTRGNIEDWIAIQRNVEKGQAPLETITPEELLSLRGVYTSIGDGDTKVSDHFRFQPRDSSAPAKDDSDATPPPKKSGTIHLDDLTAGDPAEARPHDESMNEKTEPAPAQAATTTTQADLMPPTSGASPEGTADPPADSEPDKKPEPPPLTDGAMKTFVSNAAMTAANGDQKLAKKFISEWGTTTNDKGVTMVGPPSLPAVTRKRLRETLYPNAKKAFEEMQTPPEEE